MPGSVRENDADVIAFVKDHNIKSVLDVGAGKGTYGSLLKPYVNEIHAIEVWQPYIDEFNLNELYDSVQKDDIRSLSVNKEIYGDKWDLVVFGDVLEHMSTQDSMRVWEWAAQISKYGLISVPIIHYPQGAEFNNPYEVHVQEHMHPEEIRKDYGPFILDREYEITGTFIKEF